MAYVISDACVSCGACADSCPMGAISQGDSQTARRATRSEIRILSAVDVRALQGKVDAMARELRLLDNQLQQINWTTEL